VTPPMRFLLDTNVVSEIRKSQPAGGVLLFMRKTDASALFISVLTLGELRRGASIKKRTDAELARRLAEWIEGIEYSFADRVLGVDAAIARIWGELSADRSRPVVDTLLAATAIAHNLTFVTRNVHDVNDITVDVLNPWTKL
jgi:predicted nucleic acid-binding protein